MNVMSLLVGFIGGIVAMILLRPTISKGTMKIMGATMWTRKKIKGAYNWAAALMFIALMVILVRQGGV